MLKRLLFVVLMAFAAIAQATVYSLPWGPKPQFVDSAGAPMTGGTLTTYLAGSSTLQATYTDSTGGSSNSTTITLNTRGETPNEVWLAAGVSYKFVLKDSSGTTIWTVDNVTGVNDVTSQLGAEWVASGLTPTYVSATSFTLSGDQRTAFHVGRRLKSTNSGGTVYSTITAVAFGASTTVTVANDSGTLDAGLSAVSYGVISSTNTSVSPDMVHRKGTAVASAATTDIWSIVGDYVHVTGVVTITSLGTAPYAGAQRVVVFDGALTLTHNATTLLLPGGVNIQTAANDRMVVRADTTANMVVVSYFQAATGAFLNINGFTEDTSPDLAADFVATYDVSATSSKKVLLGRIGSGVLSAEQVTTSGTSIDFTAIPSWVKEITIQFAGVSTSGTSNLIIQLGDSGGVEAAGYLGASSNLSNGAAIAVSNYTTGFGINSGAAANVLHGAVRITLEDAANFTWIASGVLAVDNAAATFLTAGSKSTSAALDRVRITTVGGADTFDAGAISILYR
jgi:hypothetical protein